MKATTSRRRNLFDAIRLWFLETDAQPSQHELAAWLFLRGMGFVYFAAFVSFAVQATGLIGSHGILPLAEYMAAAEQYLGAGSYRRLPMLFWVDHSDLAIQAVCWTGAVLSLLVVFNIFTRTSLLLLYIFYLSLFHAGQTFMMFQWDLFLLESGIVAFVLASAAMPGLWLMRWLLFRLMLMSGAVKVLSGDASWATLTSLFYYFETQPLPTPLAWYAHHLPQGLLTAMTMCVLIIELIFPLLIFCGRRGRFVAASAFLLLQIVIVLTGNYNFFNFVTMLVCLTMFDDRALQKIIPQHLGAFLQKRIKPVTAGKYALPLWKAFAVFLVIASLLQTRSANGILSALEPFHLVGTYGPFAVMTTKRMEIIIEGSEDGAHWSEYTFQYKPDDVMRSPTWNIPHQPRMDWQMWFAVLGTPEQNLWFARLLQRLLENAPEVTALFATNPFAPPRQPPQYIRALLYQYRFTTPEEKEQTGAWWMREARGMYLPVVRAAGK